MNGMADSTEPLLSPIVYPSGGLLATESIPVEPPAPVRFSRTTCCPSSPLSPCASVREKKSAGPPAGKGTISLMGLVGKPWADAEAGNSIPASTAEINARRFILSSLVRVHAGRGRRPIHATRRVPILRSQTGPSTISTIEAGWKAPDVAIRVLSVRRLVR